MIDAYEILCIIFLHYLTVYLKCLCILVPSKPFKRVYGIQILAVFDIGGSRAVYGVIPYKTCREYKCKYDDRVYYKRGGVL